MWKKIIPVIILILLAMSIAIQYYIYYKNRLIEGGYYQLIDGMVDKDEKWSIDNGFIKLENSHTIKWKYSYSILNGYYFEYLDATWPENPSNGTIVYFTYINDSIRWKWLKGLDIEIKRFR